MIRFDRVSFRYDHKENISPVIGEVSFSVNPHEVVGLLGKNGSGKSTLSLLASGLLLPSSGQVFVGEISTATRDPEIQRRVGILFQDPDRQIVGTTVEEDLAFGLENLALTSDEMKSRIFAVSRDLGLDKILDKPIGFLSGGMKQKLALASVLVMKPEILILDEPTAQLDPWSRSEFWLVLERLLRAGNLGILIISQRPQDLEHLERILVLFEGNLVFDGKADLLWEHENLESWGIPVPEGVKFKREINFGKDLSEIRKNLNKGRLKNPWDS